MKRQQERIRLIGGLLVSFDVVIFTYFLMIFDSLY